MDPRIAALPALAANGIILSWINKLERKCECSADWRREYIKYYSILSIILVFANMFIPLFLAQQKTAILLVIGLAGLVNLASILSYIPDLKKKQCDCAIKDDWRDNFIFWWTLIGLILTIVASGAAGFMLTRK